MVVAEKKRKAHGGLFRLGGAAVLAAATVYKLASTFGGKEGELTTTRPSKTLGTLFVDQCSWRSDKDKKFCTRLPTIAQLFPEYLSLHEILENAGRPELAESYWEMVSCFEPESLARATDRDLAVSVGPPRCFQKLMHFPGTQLHLNTEGYDLHPHDVTNDGDRTFDYLPPGERTFLLGVHEDTDRSIQLPLVTWLFNDFFAQDPHQQRSLFKPRHRPRNNGRHFLLYAHSHYVEYREKAFFDLSAINEVHAGGTCFGNREGRPEYVSKDDRVVNSGKCTPFPSGKMPENIVPSPHVLNGTDPSVPTWRTNYEMFQHYRFGLVMENMSRNGYVTEKILNAFLGGAVPIYYGTKDVFDIFNRDAFVYYDVDNPGEALERIRFLENHPMEYKKILKQPILADGDHTIEKYFSFDESIGGGKVKQRIRQMMGFGNLHSDLVRLQKKDTKSTHL